MKAIGLLACCFALTLVLPAQDGRKNKSLRKELDSSYRIWRDTDVAYIITDEEGEAFKRLINDEEREQFVEQFWLRRDPTPGTNENEYKEEHYRRIAFANEHFQSGIPGWKTDRGRVYITFGPPDEIVSHPSGTAYERPVEQGGGRTQSYPFEAWRYRYLETMGSDIVMEFVDRTLTGEYRLALDPSEKDALQNVPGSAARPDSVRSDGKQFDRIQQYALAHRPPRVRFRDLDAIVTSAIRYNTLPLKVRTDYFRVTESTLMAPVTIELDNDDLHFQQGRATVNLYIRITSVTRRIAASHEDVVTVEGVSGRSSVYQKAFHLAPGMYRVDVVAKDVASGNLGTAELTFRLPVFEPDKLELSSLMLADRIERLPSNQIGAGQFAIGALKVRPRVTGAFGREETIHVYAEASEHSADTSATYRILRGDEVMQESTDAVTGPSRSLRKTIAPSSLDPGEYKLETILQDRATGQIARQSTPFTIR